MRCMLQVARLSGSDGEAPVPIRAANGFLPGSLKCTGPDANHEGVLSFAEVAFRRAQKVGIETICFGSSGARSIPAGFNREAAEGQFVELLRKMGALAEPYGVTVAVEPLTGEEAEVDQLRLMLQRASGERLPLFEY